MTIKIFIQRLPLLPILLFCLAPAMASGDLQTPPVSSPSAPTAQSPGTPGDNPPTHGSDTSAQKSFPQPPDPEGPRIFEENPPSHPPDGGMADIHDIKPVIMPKRLPMAPIWIAAAAIILLALFLLGRHLWRKRQGSGEIPTVAPELPPEENARLALDALAAEGLANGRQFYFRLSEILRRYLFERYGMGAPEMTPEELQPLVRALDLPAGQKQLLQAFWSRSEPVKFAGRPAVESDMTADLDAVRRFVAVTTEAMALVEAHRQGAAAADPPPPPAQREA